MATLNPAENLMQDAIDSALAAHWKLLMFQGIVMVVLGVIAVAAPVMATVAVDIFIGWLFLISGIAGLVAMFSSKNIPAFLWSLLTAALSLGAGGLLIWNPVAGAVSLTIVMTAFFIAEGVFQMVGSVGYRGVIGGSWGWMLASGIADLVLAGIIIFGWPITAVWVLGLLAGVNLITSGWAIVLAAAAGRKLAGPAATPAAAAPH